jgi:hypothetical protein
MTLVAYGLIRAPTVVGANRLRVNEVPENQIVNVVHRDMLFRIC